MGCSCNNKKNSGGHIPWVRGNKLPLVVNIYEAQKEPPSRRGDNGWTRTAYVVQEGDAITVTFKNGFQSKTMPFTIQGSQIFITDNGELPAGMYTMEICLVKANGDRGRWQDVRQVAIYENSSDAHLEAVDILGEGAAPLDADVFYYAKGEKGDKGDQGPQGPKGDTGISITGFVESGETESATLYTVTFSDGTTQQVAIPKGAKGDQGDTGVTGNGISGVAMNQDYTLTIEFTDGTRYMTPPLRGPQGPKGDTVIIGDEQTYTLYGVTGQNSDGAMTQKAVTDALVGSAIAYDNSQSGLAAENVQGAVDEIEGQFYIGIKELDFTANTRTLNFWIGGSGNWNETSNSYPYYSRILCIEKNRKYRITAESDTQSQYALLKNNNPVTGQRATNWNGGTPKLLAAGSSVVIDSGEYSYLYCRFSNSVPLIYYPSKVEEYTSIYDEIEDSLYPYLNTVNFLGETSAKGFWIGSSGNWNAKSDTYPYYCRILAVEKNHKYKITANNTRNVQYALLPNNTPVGGQQATDWNNGITKVIGIGDSANIETGNYGYLYMRWDETYYDYPEKIEEYISVKEALKIQETKRELDMEYGFIYATGDSTGYNSPTISDSQNYKYWRSAGFVKVKGGYYYTVSTDVNGSYIRFYWYDDNRGFVGITTVNELSIGEDGLYYASAPAIGQYLRVVIYYETEYVPQAYIYGILEEDCICKLSGAVPSGVAINFIVSTYYQTLNSDIEDTTTIQDAGYKLINRGLLQLPTNYDPDGEPSRLVIYCHGADGFQNWNNDTTSFDVDHIDPTLWVNSGYAVMDMDDLTRTTYLQGQDIPTLLTQNCYKAGYEHVLRNYNIRKDGVILCGRSLGGQRVMMLLESQLPILCCCLIAPSCCFSRYWNMGDRRRITTVYNNFPTTIDIDGVETDINWGSSNAITDIEWTAMQKYYRLVLNTHGILKLLCVAKSDFFASHTINGQEVSLRSNPEIWDRGVFTDWVGKTSIPIKIWYAEDDTTLPDPTRNQDLLYNIVNNGGGLCEYHIFATGGHYPERDGATVTYTNKYGETFQNASMVYAEMLQFIRRYEKRDN